MESYKDKCNNVINLLKAYTSNNIVVAFSGGVDSTLLLKLACLAAKNTQQKVYAVTMHTKLHPAADLEAAKKTAAEIGAVHKILYINELKEAGISDNPKNRCYLCKKYLFSHLKNLAEELQAGVILEGTNADDLKVYRPGIAAIQELGIISPLVQAELTKKEVRHLAKEYGLSAADRPSVPCLATRFPYGTKLSVREMQKVETAENYLHQQGFYNVRVRVHQDIARLEIDICDMNKLLQQREEILSNFKKLGYSYITLDLEGFRSGSMDISVK